ncbi:hypothetical protein TNCV_4000861 [Trichonephila clavipes]|nr:hypothetical protein TNCV_4000861 [Trichonephila clavipes]
MIENIKIIDILKNNQFTKADILEFIRKLYPVREEFQCGIPPANRQQYEQWNSGRVGEHQCPVSNLGCGSPVVNVSDHGRHVMSSSPVPLKTRRVGQRCTLNLSRAQMSSRRCGVVVRRSGASSGVVHVT